MESQFGAVVNDVGSWKKDHAEVRMMSKPVPNKISTAKIEAGQGVRSLPGEALLRMAKIAAMGEADRSGGKPYMLGCLGNNKPL